MLTQTFWRILLVGFLITLAGQLAAGDFHTQYHYNPYGEAAMTTFTNGESQTIHYNQRGSQRELNHDIGYRLSHEAYSLTGQVRQTRYAAFTAAGIQTPAGLASYAYDALDRPTQLKLDLNGVQTYRAYDLGYDELGLVTGQTIDSESLSGRMDYRYGSQGELLSYSFGGEVVNYTYDRHGNLTQHGAVGDMIPYQAQFSAGNPYHQDGRTYDAAGRLLEDEDYRYSYGMDERLALIRNKRTQKVVANYLYDHEGRRVRQMEPGQTTWTHYNTQGEVLEQRIRREDDATEVDRHYLTLNGQSLATVEFAWNLELLSLENQFRDRMNNPVVRWSDNQPIRGEYSPYGQQLAAVDTHVGPYGFTGVHSDDATGLTYMQARFYDGTSGQFTRPDPARAFNVYMPGSYNLYNYSLNNPVNFYDPNGMAPKSKKNWNAGLGKVLKGSAKLAISAAAAVASTAVPALAAVVVPAAIVSNVKTYHEMKDGLAMMKYDVDDPKSWENKWAGIAESIGLDPDVGKGAAALGGETIDAVALYGRSSFVSLLTAGDKIGEGIDNLQNGIEKSEAVVIPLHQRNPGTIEQKRSWISSR